MAQYPKPTGSTGTFNNGTFTQPTTGLTVEEGKKYFITFPNTQSPSTIISDNFTTTGDLNVAGDSQFGGDVNFLGGVSITGGITFENDVEVVGTTTLDDNLLCLQTAEIDGELTCNSNIVLVQQSGDPVPYIEFSDGTKQTTANNDTNAVLANQNNTFLAPYQQTFAGNSSTGNINGPIKITNGITNEYATVYLDASPGSDLTIYTNQNPGGGLTIRGANGASFTMNPASVTDGYGCLLLNPLSLNGNTLSGLNNLVANNNSYITLQDDINMNSNNIYNVSALNGINGGTLTIGTQGATKISVAGGTLTADTGLGVEDPNSTSLLNMRYYTAGQFSINGSATDTINLSVAGTNLLSMNSTSGLSTNYSLNLNAQNLTNIGAFGGYNSNITVNSNFLMGVGADIVMNTGDITGMGANSSAYTQLTTDSTTKVATTAFVHNVVNAIPSTQFTTTNPAGQITIGNLSNYATTITTVKNNSTTIVYNSGNISFLTTAGTTIGGLYQNFPANTLYPSTVGNPVISSNTSYCIITSASGTGMIYPLTIGSITPTSILFSISNPIQATYDLYLNFTINY